MEASFAELVHEDIIALAHAAPGLVVVLGAYRGRHGAVRHGRRRENSTPVCAYSQILATLAKRHSVTRHLACW